MSNPQPVKKSSSSSTSSEAAATCGGEHCASNSCIDAGPWTQPSKTSTDGASIAADVLEAKLAIAQLEAKVKDRMAKLNVLHDAGLLEDDGEPGRYVFPGIVFQRCKKTTFTYSPSIKALQKEEQANGTATKNETFHFRSTIDKQ